MLDLVFLPSRLSLLSGFVVALTRPSSQPSGWLQQGSSLDLAFYISGGLLVLSALLMLPIRCLGSARDVDRRHITPYAATPLPVNELKQQIV